MPKVENYEVVSFILDQMEKIAAAFPVAFASFDVNQVGAVMTKDKKSKRAAKLHPIKYPDSVWIPGKVYIVEVFHENWAKMDDKQKNLSLFHLMCSIPSDGFDPTSKDYAKKRRPDYEMFREEFAVTGGVPDWMDNPGARDVFDAASQVPQPIPATPST